MKHLGDITKINGHEAPPVDIITGGSPCQDLSVAGKRAGLAGERSGLFMEQIRIIKEMRDESKRRISIQGTDNDLRDIKPRYMVWENVAGAFSSNGGEDFRAVLEETARIAETGVCIPRLKEGQRWPHAGTIVGDGWSIAWRLHDAQYWGVPQRRKRISLVADFGGDTAAQILFESNSMPRDPQKSEDERQTPTTTTGDDTDKTSKSTGGNGNGKTSCTITGKHQNFISDYTAIVLENHPQDSRLKIKNDGIFQTMGARQGSEGDPHTLMVMIQEPFLIENTQEHGTIQNTGICTTNQGQNAKYDISIEEEKSQPLIARGPNAVEYKAIVRRLTPLECERLQGYPDGWTDIGEWTDNKGKKHKDSDAPRYKALGNSIALPFWEWMAERMINELRATGNEEPTMASLFDGIGGFPLVYSRHGCQPVWASEIEEFPIAVTRYHFGDQ